MPEELPNAAFLASQIDDRSIKGIALSIRALIRSGVLPVGSRLPPIRDLAAEMGVSPATVAGAWGLLRNQRVLTGQGRNGTWVSGAQSVSAPTRFASTGHFGPDVLDLALAVPDLGLLPPLATALAHGAQAESLNSYARVAILPELEAAVRSFWPYEPEAFLATNGGYSAIYTLFHALSLSGAKVAIEQPTAMRHLDILEDLGATILPVECDAEGPRPDSLAAALAQKPTVFLFQPRLHSVTGQTVSPARLARLGQVLAGSDVIVIEDDGLSELASIPPQSLGRLFPDRVAHVYSVAKTLGPDLRLAVLSGPAPLVAQVRSFRSFSSGWTSRILQGAAAWLLRDPQTRDAVVQSREIYNRRRAMLIAALRAEGGAARDGHGMCAWIPVTNEQFSMVTLAARGIAVAPGSRFGVTPQNHIRVATSILPEARVAEVATALVLAATDPMQDPTTSLRHPPGI